MSFLVRAPIVINTCCSRRGTLICRRRRDAGHVPPTLEEVGTRFRVTLWLKRIAAPAVDDAEEAIRDEIRVPARFGRLNAR